MSTTPITCPKCNAYIRVAVQPSTIVAVKTDGKVQQLLVTFHGQVVAHECKEDK